MDIRSLLLDRDGTLNRDLGVIQTPDQMQLLPDAAEGLRSFRDAGILFFIVTNQGAIGAGLDTESNYHACTDRLLALLEREGIHIEAVQYCPHRKEPACGCRKPALGMWRTLAERFALDPETSLMVGDKDSDVLFGKNAGMHTARIASGQYPQTVDAEYTVRTLLELADLLL